MNFFVKKKNQMLHLDLKGVAPSGRKLAEFISSLSGLGFRQIFLEFDCRYDWKSWPGASRPLYTEDDLNFIRSTAMQNGVKLVPVIQSLGHLDWVLRNEEYTDLRENGLLTEMCCAHSRAGEKIKTWIEEAIALFPECEYVHLGGDEVASLGSCPRCATEALRLGGSMPLYIKYLEKLCRFVLEHGKRPVVWGDMFWRHQCAVLAEELPKETVIIDWHYGGNYPFPSTAELRKTNLEIWGASALQCASCEIVTGMLQSHEHRLKNIQNWYNSDIPVLHTCWSRPNNFLGLYAPFTAQWPLFVAASDWPCWVSHPWFESWMRLMNSLARGYADEIETMRMEIRKLPITCELECEALEYWDLGLQYKQLRDDRFYFEAWKKVQMVKTHFGGIDPIRGQKMSILLKKNRDEFNQLEPKIREFFQKYDLSDVEEFIAERRIFFES